MKYTAWLLALLISFSAVTAFAVDSYEEYVKQQMKEYNDYLEEIDREFSAFLKQQWQAYKGEEPEKLIEKPKPVDIPVAKPKAKPEPIVIKVKPEPKPAPVADSKPEPAPAQKPVAEKKQEPVKEPEVAEKPQPKEEPVVVPPVVIAPKEPEPQVAAPKEPEPAFQPKKKAEGLEFAFYGVDVDVPFDMKLATPVAVPMSSKNISKWWESVASADYKKTLKYLDNTADKMNLGDWGYFNLCERFAANLVGNKPERKMLVWFLMLKGGYDVKLGFTKEGETKVMAPSDQQLYGVPFYTFTGKRYYVLDAFGKQNSSGSLYTYKGNYPAAKKTISLAKLPTPKLGFAGYARDLKFKLDGKEQTVRAIANKFNIAYFKNFPQSDLMVYTSSKKPDWVESMVPELRELIKGKNQKDAVNTLLNFVQNAFEYKTDDQQFGHEKFLFAEETIYYPYSDCEDRSVMFTYLVNRLLGIEIVMLDFPGHIATAVNLGKANTGAVLSYKGKKYSVADPTYINATVGMVMPQFKNVSPGIIEPEI